MWSEEGARAATCEGTARADLQTRGAGLRGGEAAARTVLTDRPMTSIPHRASPQPSGWACDFRGATLRPGAAAGCLRLQRSRKFSIQNSRFKMRWACRVCLGIRSDSGCSLRRAARSGPAGRELRASAPGRLRPATVPFRNSQFIIQDSKSTAGSRCLKRSNVSKASPSLAGGCTPPPANPAAAAPALPVSAARARCRRCNPSPRAHNPRRRRAARR